MQICHLCQSSLNNINSTTIQLPALHHPDQIKISIKKICKSCNNLITQLYKFYHAYSFKFGITKIKSYLLDIISPTLPQPTQNIIQAFSATTIQPRNRTNSDIRTLRKTLNNQIQKAVHPYQLTIIQQIKTKGMIQLSYLPKSLQLFVYLSCNPQNNNHQIKQKDSQDTNKKSKVKSSRSGKQYSLQVQAIMNQNSKINEDQRKQKVKNLILYAVQKMHISIQQLQYVCMIINFLLCLMDPQRTASVLQKLGQIILLYPNIITWKSLITEQETSPQEEPLSPASSDPKNMLLRLDKLWHKIQTVIIVGGKGSVNLRQGIIKLNSINPSDHGQYKKIAYELVQQVRSNKNQESIDNEKIQNLLNLKFYRNSFELVLRELKDQEQNLKSFINQLTSRFKLQKEQYINKIVQLNNKIQQLQKVIIQKQRQKNTTSKQQMKKQEINIDIQTSQKCNCHQETLILTDLINFNEKYIAKIGNINQSPSKIIVNEINRLQQQFIKNQNKLKSSQQQKTRLLGILSRKEDRLLGLITERDIRIEKYQQALMRMENGLQVTQQPMAHRIKYIIHLWSQGHKQNNVKIQKQQKQKNCQIY